MKTIKTIIYIR